ncbi:Nicotinamide riboside kinase [Balamuthia mandrillaris]
MQQEEVEEAKELLIPPVVVGVAGATRSGKTSLCRSLAAHFQSPCPILSQDHFVTFAQVDKPTGFRNYETPHSTNWNRLLSTLQQLIQQFTITISSSSSSSLQQPRPHFIFVEGFLLFHHPQLLALLDVKLFLLVSRKVCLERRMRTTAVPQRYFDKLIWPNYLKYNHSCRRMEDVFVVDGSLPAERVCKEAVSFITGNKTEEERANSRKLLVDAFSDYDKHTIRQFFVPQDKGT